MKRVMLLLALLFVASVFGYGQTQIVQSMTVSSTAGCTASAGAALTSTSSPCGGQGMVIENSNFPTHTLTWSGTASTCTVELESSSDGSTFVLAGTLQTCTSASQYSFSGTAKYYRVNFLSLTTTGSNSITLQYTASALGSGGSDGYFFVPETACGGGVTGTGGSGNATDIVALSGGMRVFRLSNTNAGASNNTFTCTFSVPGRLTAGKGITITDITFIVSTQTTQPTSITLPTLKTATAPAAVDPETANSATFVTAGGTLSIVPTSAQFAAYSPVSAGQFFSVKTILGTPVTVTTDLQMFQYVILFAQSAAAAGVQETPGFFVHYIINS